jgi:hypothetical protein
MPTWNVDLVKYNFLCSLHDKIGFKIVEVDIFQGFALGRTKWSQLLDSNQRKLGWIFKNHIYIYIYKLESEIKFRLRHCLKLSCENHEIENFVGMWTKNGMVNQCEKLKSIWTNKDNSF